MESRGDATTAEQLSSRINNLQTSIWTDLTTTTRHQSIAELDSAWGGRGWVPPWPQPDGTPCTFESLPSSDILNLASITRLCIQHNVRLSSLWEPTGILVHMVQRNAPDSSPVWSRDSGAQAVLETYTVLNSTLPTDPWHFLRDAGPTQSGDISATDDQGARKRRRLSLPELEGYPPALPLPGSSTAPGQAFGIDEALEEARDLQQALQNLFISLRGHLERFPLVEGPSIKAEFERIQIELAAAQAGCLQADEEVKRCERAYKSLQEGSNAATSQYNILKEWLEPVLLANQGPGGREQGEAVPSPAPYDPELKNAMETVSRLARQTLETYCSAQSSEETLNSLIQVLDQLEAARARRREARLALQQAQSKTDQMKPRLDLASQRIVLKETMQRMVEAMDANRSGKGI